MSYLKVWIHLVWTTKNREPVLIEAIRFKIFDHIKTNARANNIYVDHINGYTDHVHVLVSLKADQTIAKVAQMLKGESAFWINKTNLTESKFVWQDDYFAISVSESQVNTVRNYIRKQKEHHERQSFEEEFHLFKDRLQWPSV